MLGLSAGNLVQFNENDDSELGQIIMTAEDHSIINLTYSIHGNTSDFCWLSIGPTVNNNMLRANYANGPVLPSNTVFYPPIMQPNVQHNIQHSVQPNAQRNMQPARQHSVQPNVQPNVQSNMGQQVCYTNYPPPLMSIVTDIPIRTMVFTSKCF